MHLNDLSFDEKTALHHYKNAENASCGYGGMCFGLNSRLQGGLFPSELESDLQAQVKYLDQVFARVAPSPADMTIYRGVSMMGPLDPVEFGRRFRNLAYWSTSASRSAAVEFTKNCDQGGRVALISLRILQGTPAYDMETLVGSGGLEREILLPRGLQWIMTDIKHGDMNEIPALWRNKVGTFADIALECVPNSYKPVNA
jgi:hypothetical protein